MKILVTGAAGFIGFHLCNKLLDSNYNVFGVDDLNDYYSPKIKSDRIMALSANKNYDNFKFLNLDVTNFEIIEELFKQERFDQVLHLAAEPGVRNSIDNPKKCVKTNINGLLSILQACRKYPVSHLLFASSSSVYGINHNPPFNIDDNTDYPVSLYAASKKSNELMAYSYSQLFDMKVTGLRFFTVYGPFGRPDMAYFKFTRKIMEDEHIELYNKGDMKRDFTYIDDVVDAVLKIILLHQKNPDKMSNFEVFNIGNNDPITLTDLISAIEKATGKTAIKKLLPMQSGDVPLTYAGIDTLSRLIGYKPKTKIDHGISEFVKWYKKYFQEP